MNLIMLVTESNFYVYLKSDIRISEEANTIILLQNSSPIRTYEQNLNKINYQP